MFTRSQYLNKECTHDEYYGQLVTELTVHQVNRFIGSDRIKNSKDPHFNDIPLSEWDRVGALVNRPLKLRDLGDYATISSGVCIAKAAARQIRDSV